MATINTIFKNARLLYGGKTMFKTYKGERFTFAQFSQRVQDIKHTLYYYGVRKGDKVAVLAEDTPQWNMAFYAIATMGAVIVPISKFKDVSIIHRETLAAECKFLILQSDIISETTFAKLREDTHLTIIDIDNLRCVLSPNRHKQAFKFNDDINYSLTMPKVEIFPTDLAAAKIEADPYSVNVTYVTHEELINEAKEQTVKAGLKEEDIVVSIMPISYSNRKLITAVMPVISGNLIVFKPRHSNFKTILSLINDVKPTVIFTVPKVLELVYASSMIDNKSKALMETDIDKIGFFDKMRLKIQGSKLYKTLGGKVRVCSLDDQPKTKRVERFLKYSGLKLKMKFS